MKTAQQHLQDYQVTMEEAYAFVTANLTSPKTIFDACKTFGVTNAMLAEIVQPKFSGVTANEVKAFFASHQFNADLLDVADNGSTIVPTPVSHVLQHYSVDYKLQLDDVLAFNDRIFVVGDYTTSSVKGQSHDLFVASLNSDLTVAKQKVIGDIYTQYNPIAEGTREGGLIVAGTYLAPEPNGDITNNTKPDSFVMLLDANLNVVKTLKIGLLSGVETINDVIQRPDGKILVVGSQNDSADGTQITDAYLLMLNSDMTIAKQVRFDNPKINSGENFNSVYVLADNSVLAVGSGGVVSQFDADLNLIRTLDFNKAVNHFNQLDNGRLFASASNFLYEFSSDLTVINAWQANFQLDQLQSKNNQLYAASVYDANIIEIDLSSSEPVLTQQEYVKYALNAGYALSTDFALFHDQVLMANLRDGMFYALNLDVETRPNMESNYRSFEGDLSKLSLNRLDATKAISALSVDYSVQPVSIVGTLDFYNNEVTDLLQASKSVSLIA